MSRGMRRTTPAAATGGAWSTQEGQWLPEAKPVEDAPTPATEPPAAGGKKSASPPGMMRQSLDLPRVNHRKVQHRASVLAESMEVTAKQINAQTILRKLVDRYVNDEELRNSIDKAIRNDVKPV